MQIQPRKIVKVQFGSSLFKEENSSEDDDFLKAAAAAV